MQRNFEPYIRDLDNLYSYLEKKYGFEFDKKKWGHLSFKKQTERLNLPISFEKRPEDKLYSTTIDTSIVYRLKP